MSAYTTPPSPVGNETCSCATAIRVSTTITSSALRMNIKKLYRPKRESMGNHCSSPIWLFSRHLQERAPHSAARASQGSMAFRVCDFIQSQSKLPALTLLVVSAVRFPSLAILRCFLYNPSPLLLFLRASDPSQILHIQLRFVLKPCRILPPVIHARHMGCCHRRKSLLKAIPRRMMKCHPFNYVVWQSPQSQQVRSYIRVRTSQDLRFGRP